MGGDAFKQGTRTNKIEINNKFEIGIWCAQASVPRRAELYLNCIEFVRIKFIYVNVVLVMCIKKLYSVHVFV